MCIIAFVIFFLMLSKKQLLGERVYLGTIHWDGKGTRAGPVLSMRSELWSGHVVTEARKEVWTFQVGFW